MSAVIIGGNECMQRRYVDVCARYACDAKVFPLKTGDIARRLGNADVVFVCMDTVYHTMAQNAVREARRHGLKLVKLPKNSACALERELMRHVASLVQRKNEKNEPDVKEKCLTSGFECVIMHGYDVKRIRFTSPDGAHTAH